MISIFICGTLIFNMGTFAYAETAITEISIDESFMKSKISQTFSEMELEKSIGDINLISEKAIPADYLSEVFVEDGQHVYIYQLTDDVKSKIKVNEITNGIKLNIVEGEKEDELILYDNGNMVLNSNEVIFEDVTKNVNNKIQLRGYTEYTTETPPYGRTNEYNYYAGSDSVRNVDTNTLLSNITVGALATVLSYAVSISLIGLGWGLIYAVILGVAEEMIQNPSDPLSESVSYTLDTYYHEDAETFRINSYLSAEKVVVDLYDQLNFEGNSSRAIFYSCVDHT